MLRQLVALAYTPESERTDQKCFSFHVYSLLLWLAFTARYSENFVSLYSLSLSFDAPSQFDKHALAIAERGEQKFNEEKGISKLTNKHTKYFNRTIAVRQNARDIGEELFGMGSDSQQQNTRIKKKIASVPKFVIDTRYLGTEEDWAKIRPTIYFFIEQWCPRYLDFIYPLDNGHFLLRTSGEEHDVRV